MPKDTIRGMYRVQFYCPTSGIYDWQNVPDNPFWILGNAVKRCNALLWQYHAARVVDGSGNVLHSV
jgi:hypothetical protein